ncbi:S-layer homology domain-containing protein [Paenibacillus monticola]|nr:S-layer homology domain-containing protein [Paenibacillus monticola]
MSIFLVLLMVLSGILGVVGPGEMTASAAASDFAGGTGTASDPHQIATADQLDEVRNHLEAGLYFELTADIDLSSYASGEGWTPIGDMSNSFKGNMEGNGFKITNLKMDRQGQTFIGLFVVNGGIMTNLILENIEVKGYGNVGGLAGRNHGTIRNSYAAGSVSGGRYVGGLVGVNFNGTIANSNATGSVSGDEYVGGLVGSNTFGSISNSYATGNVSGSLEVGGLVGENYSNGTIRNSYATGSVSGYRYVGGLVGENSYGTISNSYATGSVSGNSPVGGLVGEDFPATGSTHSFYDSNTTGQLDTGKGTGKTTGEMKDPTTFSDWSFSEDWYMLSGQYPQLWAFIALTPGTNVGTTKLNNIPNGMEYSIDSTNYTAITGSSVDNITVDSGDEILVRVVSPNSIAKIFTVDKTNIKPAAAPQTAVLTVGTTIPGTTKLNDVTSDMEYRINTGSYTTIVGASVDNIAVEVGDRIYVRVKETITQPASNEQLLTVDAGDIRKLIATAAIDGVTAPVAGATPVNVVTYSAEYTAVVSWSPATTLFVGETAYTATIIITPTAGYTLTGVPANFFSVAGATTTNAADSGVVTALFPATAAIPVTEVPVTTVPIATAGIAGVTAPVTGSTPVTTVTYSVEYTATVSWSPTTTLFAQGTVYTATITISPKAGFTLTGVPANFFSVAGATTTNVADSGVVTAVFLATAPVSTDTDTGTYTGTGSTFTLPTNSIVTSTNGNLTLPVNQSGEVSFEDAVKISIPVGAINKELILSIHKVLDTQILFANKEILLSPVYEITKNFAEDFSKPITMNFTFDSTLVRSNQKAAVFYYDEVKKAWVEVAGGKIEGNHIIVEVNHFGKYAVLSVNEVTGLPVSEPVTDTTTVMNFSDVTGHWAEVSIQQALSMGMVKGYTDGTFQPNHTVTRAEFAVMLMNVLKPQGAGADLTFTDTATIGAWAQTAVAQAVQTGMITGYEDGGFRPNTEITRAEMAVILAKALGESTEVKLTTSFADDKEIPVWAKAGVDFVKQAGIVQGKGDNEFAPQDSATRAEAVTVLLKLLAQRSN